MVLGMSSWLLALTGVVAQVLWCVRTAISAYLVDRITKIVVEKADVRDLPAVLTGLGVLAAALPMPRRPAPGPVGSKKAVTDDEAAMPEGGPVR